MQTKKDGIIEQALLQALKVVLNIDEEDATINQTNINKTNINETLLSQFSNEQWKAFFALADRHEVLTLLEPVLREQALPSELGETLLRRQARTVHKGICLQMLDVKITKLLESEKITAITLKGNAVAAYYPTPEMRKTTDIDLLVPNEKDADKSIELLCQNGFTRSKEQHALHHVVLGSPDGQVVEIHKLLANPFMDQKLNHYLEQVKDDSLKHCHKVSYQGISWYAYDMPWQGYYLLIHMLQHFLTSGFGLRNLCDWVVLWNHCESQEERAEFVRLVSESGLMRFAAAVTAVCIENLGLKSEKSPVPCHTFPDKKTTDALLEDIFLAGEFGHSEETRMVGLQGTSPWAYVKEFHHQMHLNFPNEGKNVLLWPILWVKTLTIFLKNNKRLHRPSVRALMKKAKERGILVDELTGKRA